MAEPRIAPMTLGDLDRALDWAAAEGWNPGLDDAAAFHAADPGGFLMGWIGAEPVASISIVRHAPDHAFLGLYIVRPDWRGQGIGMALWRAALEVAGHRTIGLDGVVAQQANYARSGFALTHRTIRFAGTITSAPTSAPSTAARPVAAADIPALIALDARLSGIARPAYLTAWFTDALTRQSLVLREGDRITGVGTIRACREGHKIGPLFATSATDAETLLRSLARATPAGQIILDAPSSNPAATTLARSLSLTPIFETARMIRGTPPIRDAAQIFGEVTLELG